MAQISPRPFRCSVITPESVVFDDDVTFAALPAHDGNDEADYYMQFRVSDQAIHAGAPTTRVEVVIEYADEGTDLLGMQYDAVNGGPGGDGGFKDVPALTKEDTGCWRRVRYVLEDAYFAGRQHGADFRIDDRGDGAETVRRVGVRLLPPRP